MKINGRNLKRRLYGLTTIPQRVARVRYFRGHGVHSPFVYSIVRQAFMKRDLLSEDQQLYDALLQRGFPRKRAIQLQNLYTHCDYHAFAIDQFDEHCDLCLLTEQVGEQATRELMRRAAECHATVALISPYEGRERAELGRQLIEEHPCTSVDKRAFILFFTNEKLPKQHYRI